MAISANESRKEKAAGSDSLPRSAWFGGVAVKWSTHWTKEMTSAMAAKATAAFCLSDALPSRLVHSPWKHVLVR